MTEYTILQVSEAMDKTTGLGYGWWKDEAIESALRYAAEQGYVSRLSTVQVQWTEKGINKLEDDCGIVNYACMTERNKAGILEELKAWGIENVNGLVGFPDGFQFTVVTELAAYKAAYAYKFAPQKLVEPNPLRRDGWLVTIWVK